MSCLIQILNTGFTALFCFTSPFRKVTPATGKVFETGCRQAVHKAPKHSKKQVPSLMLFPGRCTDQTVLPHPDGYCEPVFTP